MVSVFANNCLYITYLGIISGVAWQRNFWHPAAEWQRNWSGSAKPLRVSVKRGLEKLDRASGSAEGRSSADRWAVMKSGSGGDGLELAIIYHRCINSNSRERRRMGCRHA